MGARQFLAKECAKILVNRFQDWACPGKVCLDKLTALDMTLVGRLGRKTTTQTNNIPVDYLLIISLSMKWQLYTKRPAGRLISAPDFGSCGPGFESHWRRNLAHDLTALFLYRALHYQPFIFSIWLI